LSIGNYAVELKIMKKIGRQKGRPLFINFMYD
jgi:hypothetical protein